MKTLKIVPMGWPCLLEECPPGFFICDEQLCFKSEYGAEMQYYNSAGEHFCARNIEVQPVYYEWDDES